MTANDGLREEEEDCRNSKKVAKLVNPWNWYPYTWNVIFLGTCVFGVMIDPLFLYVPVINSDKKCFAADDRMKYIAVTLRTLTDVYSLFHIFMRLRNAAKMADKLRISLFSGLPWIHLLVNILAILPIPQVIVLGYLSKFASWRYLRVRISLNWLLVLQYIPRLIRVYFSAKELGRALDSLTWHVWIRGAFFFMHYIIGAHVFGALWYFNAVFRETTCWHRACKNMSGCDQPVSFSCESQTLVRNTTYLKQFCAVDPTNPEAFDFGIFSEAVKSGIIHGTDFRSKFLRSFWWGLSSLSSFGQSLETSIDPYENLFAVLISISGLLLFLYLIGNLQTYIQLSTTKSEEVRKKISMKRPEIDSYLTSNNLPAHKKNVVIHYLQQAIRNDNEFDVKSLLALLEERTDLDTENFSSWVTKIMSVKRRNGNAEIWIRKNEIGPEMKSKILRYVELRLADGKDTDVENLMLILPTKLGLSIKKFLCFPILKKIPMLENIDDHVYRMICIYAKPTIYAEKSYVIRKEEPIDFLLLVTQGILWSLGSESSPTKRVQKGDFWGEELLEWRLRTTSYSEFPISKSNLKCHTKVEGFALMAVDLERVLTNCWSKFPISGGLKPFAAFSLQTGFRRFIRNKKAMENNKLSIVTSYT